MGPAGLKNEKAFFVHYPMCLDGFRKQTARHAMWPQADVVLGVRYFWVCLADICESCDALVFHSIRPLCREAYLG